MFTFDGRPVQADGEQTIAAALIAAGIPAWRRTRLGGRPRGVFCGHFGISGEVSSIAICPCRCGATARIAANICVFSLPGRGCCLRDCGSPCGCLSDDEDDTWDAPCRGGVVFPYSLGTSCGGNRSVGVTSSCGCGR